MTAVLVDAVTIRPGRTGGAERFARELFSRLDRADGLKMTYVIQPVARDWFEEVVPRSRLVTIRSRRHEYVSQMLAKRHIRKLAGAQRVDVVWSPFNQPVLRTGVPEVLMIHDLAPAHYLRNHRDLQVGLKERTVLALRLARIRAGVKRAHEVVVPSSFVAADVRELSGGRVDPTVIPEGGDAAGVRDGVWQPERASRTVLVVTSGQRHKRTEMVATIAADQRVKAQDVVFVVVGIDSFRFPGVQWPGNVELRRNVPDEELGRLLSSSACLLSVSSFEGFGLPIAEAMHRGLPVVASDIPPHRELVGDAGALFSPLDPPQAAREVARLLAEPEWARRVSQGLRQRSALFRWERCAAAHRDLFAVVSAAGDGTSSAAPPVPDG